jgi:ACT domain-containing protein
MDNKKKKDTIKKRILEDKKLILSQLMKTPIVQLACQKTGVSRSTYYRWRKNSFKFSRYADRAIREGTLLVNDMAESQLLSAISDKNMTAIIFWLKNHHPVYEARIEVRATGTGSDDEELNNKQKEIVAQIFKQIGITKKNKLEKGEKDG